MKKILILSVVTLFVLLANISYAGCTLGVKDCRESTTEKGVCYWWECQQTGSETQYIFLGTKCTCPQKKSELDEPFLVAQNQCYGRSFEELKRDAKICQDWVQGWDRQFSAYVTPDCTPHIYGGSKTVFEFQKCMSDRGWPDFGFKKQ